MDKRLKRQFFYFIATGLLFSAILTTGIVIKKYGDSLFELSAKLRPIKADLDRMKAAASDIERTISEAKAAMPPGLGLKSRETAIFNSLDELKSRFRDAQISAGDINFRDEEFNLPVAVKASLRDYTVLVNDIGYLQSLRFPFFSVSAVTISEGADESVNYEIKGAFRMPKVAK